MVRISGLGQLLAFGKKGQHQPAVTGQKKPKSVTRDELKELFSVELETKRNPLSGRKKSSQSRA
ncbi:hypothetical protein [Pseudaestuariivita rosea]|uniref:hypothetical protein n=1 Tax=Pseudaestuariivita rosea TaxID=2763263 RepID=UPI001ABADE69|nr:hypothetical protein [Pseudaestuariivita rosea]